MVDENESSKRMQKQVSEALNKVGEGMKNLNYWQRNKRKIIVGGSILCLGGAIAYFSLREGAEVAVEYGQEKGKKQAEEIYTPQLSQAEQEKSAALKKAEADSVRAETAKTQAKADSLSAVSSKKDAEEARKRESAAVAQAQKTIKDAQKREREIILTVVNEYSDSIPGFNLLRDYVIDGPRSFHSDSLPWKKSMDNTGFIAYITNPAKNIEDFLRIKELGERGLIPRISVEAFFNEKYNKYNGDILGQDVRTLYKANASDGKIYGVKLQDNKVIGLDELSQGKSNYTGPNREDIKKKMPKINIPTDWRQMKSYQNQKK